MHFKDPKFTGFKTLDKMIEHVEHEPLVLNSWTYGTPPPSFTRYLIYNQLAIILTGKIPHKKTAVIMQPFFYRKEKDHAISSFAALLYSSISFFCISNSTGS